MQVTFLDPLTKTGDFPIWQFSFQNAAVWHYFNDLKCSDLITNLEASGFGLG